MKSHETKSGGSAFPWDNPCGKGMSLRDWFAGQAMASFARGREAEMFNENTIRWYARVAYELSDAMLEERGRPAERAVQRPPATKPESWLMASGAH